MLKFQKNWLFFFKEILINDRNFKFDKLMEKFYKNIIQEIHIKNLKI